ncbi:MAG TPA: hypothetical protein VF868_01400 [Bacteroidia bacterium]|jgi:antitoxin component YwqK of YwqJK toxin-antitoxin module
MKNLLFLILIAPAVAYSQTKQKENYTIYINHQEGAVKANVLSQQKKKIEVNKDLYYSWYISNKIIETQGGFEGKILDGNYTSFYSSNNLKEKGVFFKGLKNGEWITWYEDGKIQSVKNWKKGVRNGTFKNFDNNGNILEEIQYSKGKVNGYHVIYDKGTVISRKQFKNGREIIANEKSLKSKKTLKERLNSVFKKNKDNQSESKTSEGKKGKKEKTGNP